MKSGTRLASGVYAGAILATLYFPILAIALASFSRKRYFSFPISDYTTQWYVNAFHSMTISELVVTSLTIAAIVTVVSVAIGFFGALSYARYSWKGRKLFQNLVLLPLFFPQTVLGLALLLWFNFLGIEPSWKTAIIGHLVWITPISTLVIAIQAYSLDPSLEEAAFDLGASRFQVMARINLPLLSQSLVSAGLFSFLLSWGNFALSLYTTGADSTLPEWLYGKMVSGYSPMIPAVGALSVLGAVLLIVTWFSMTAFRSRKKITV